MEEMRYVQGESEKREVRRMKELKQIVEEMDDVRIMPEPEPPKPEGKITLLEIIVQIVVSAIASVTFTVWFLLNR